MPPSQTTPHAPQFNPLEQRLTGVVPAPGQVTAVRAHVAAQVPPTQVCPLTQARPQVPQLLSSTRVSVQPDGQGTMGNVQYAAHAPAMQFCPAPHARPQPPQFVLLVEVFTQTPLHTRCPVGHIGTHPVAVQPTVPPIGATQAVHSGPQWVTSVFEKH